MRIDKWLWAARFYKTRSLAARAVEGGKVQVNGERAKRSKELSPGDEVRVRQGPYEYCVRVMRLSEYRGPAAQARTLYEETAASQHAREVMAAGLKLSRGPVYEGKGRPTKRDRRRIEQLERHATGRGE